MTVRGNQVLLTLGFEASALVLPDGLAESVTAVLTGSPTGVALPWPPTVRPLTGTLPLPPSITPLGPIVWRRAPATPKLAECREIDLFSAVRTVPSAAAYTQGGG